MEPITREEYYLAKIAGTYEGNNDRDKRCGSGDERGIRKDEIRVRHKMREVVEWNWIRKLGTWRLSSIRPA